MVRLSNYTVAFCRRLRHRVLNGCRHLYVLISLADTDDPSDGYMAAATLEKQLQVMNAAYASTPFSFSLAGVSTHVNASVRSL